jgi:hypothetical protein
MPVGTILEVVVNRLWSLLRRWVSDHPAVPEAGETILTRCRYCDRPHLFRRPASAWIECSCGQAYTAAEYVQLVRDEDEFDQRAW